jgi:hypothetical protein
MLQTEKKPLFRDPYRINVNEKKKIQYFSKKMKVQPEKLERAIMLAGPLITNVQKVLGIEESI